MASREQLISYLQAGGDDESVQVTVADLSKLNAEDLRSGSSVEPVDGVDSAGTVRKSQDVILRWGESGRLVAEVEEVGWRKFWMGPLGVQEYYDLVRLACQNRSASHSDVILGSLIDEDVVYGFHYSLLLEESDLATAYRRFIDIRGELLEAAEAVQQGIVDLVTVTSRRLAGWGSEPLDQLVDGMRNGNSQEKGRTLEELTSRLFGLVPGFSATGNVRTETEEIDIHIQNASEDPQWRDERFMLLAECKNWSGKCGKNEFVIFKEKLDNRVGRVSCGFLVSWNGFADTISKEMLRGSKGDLLVVPIAGSDLRAAVREGDFPERLKALHEAAVLL